MKASHIEWTAQHTLRMLDQRKLPVEERWVEARTYQEVASAIRDMVVRGAPLIGVVAVTAIPTAGPDCWSRNFDYQCRRSTEGLAYSP